MKPIFVSALILSAVSLAGCNPNGGKETDAVSPEPDLATLSCAELHDEALTAQDQVQRLKPFADSTNVLQGLSLLTAIAGGGGTVQAGDTPTKQSFRAARTDLSEIMTIMTEKGCSQDTTEFTQTLENAGA